MMIVTVMGGWVLGQPAESPVSQSELAAPGDRGATEQAQPPSEVITPAEAPKPDQDNETQQPQPPETQSQTKTAAPSPSTASKKRVAAFWLIVPGK